MDPDPVCPERLDPDLVCPESLDPDPDLNSVCPERSDPDLDPVNIRPDPKPWHTHTKYTYKGTPTNSQ